MHLMKSTVSLGLLLLIASTSTSTANEVSKDDWINSMSTELPAYFCYADQYFRQCFNVTQAECEETALSTIRICLAQNKDKIPARLRQPIDGTKWGAIIGNCAGSAYEITLQKKRLNNSECNDPNNWK
jgi:hypothetical protein